LAAIANDFETVADNLGVKKPLTSCCRLPDRRLIGVFATLLNQVGRCWGDWPPRTSESVETQDFNPVWPGVVCPQIPRESAIVVGPKH
jgi:hypothetical protein